MVVTSDPASAGRHPPRQARTRAALQRLLTAAEQVLVNDGLDNFTIASVAEEAGVSAAGIYRRFSGKEELIDAVRDKLMTNLEEAADAALGEAEPSLAGAVTTFVHALADTLAQSGKVAPTLFSAEKTPDIAHRGLSTLTALQQRFNSAAAPHRDQISRPEPDAALDTALRTILAAGIHRAAVAPLWPDGRNWRQWADEIAGMMLTYLTAPE
ncbi:hypothetical protein AWC29_11630 [Mycobacterium triplex]|uniref:HTH tetR-type domain-containing protein n=1 Tax=Mycobacterium triplex TaxID=47839 RepID=A0ABX3WA38_9MYCO|nr:hypothetical protein AWC29_11630 [Mycobacterium triplex]